MDLINAQQLRELPSPGVKFLAQDGGAAEVLAAACPARRELELKVGAQVGIRVGGGGAIPKAAGVDTKARQPLT